MNEILIPALIVGGAGLIFGALLAVAGFIFKVKKDERIPLIEETLPGANCGGCGFAGCSAYAEAVVSGKAECDLCAVGGEEVARYIADIMGTKSEFSKKYAFIGCTGGANERYRYDGAPDCAYAAMLMGGVKTCKYGCIGLGNCIKVCPSGALSMVDSIPAVDEEKCTGCGACARACPRGLIGLIPNCAASVVNTELYLAGGMRAGAMLAGLLAGSGVGMLVLFRTNRSVRDNLKILAVVYFSGVVLGGVFGALLF